jgi:Tol biopolymer transport system component
MSVSSLRSEFWRSASVPKSNSSWIRSWRSEISSSQFGSKLCGQSGHSSSLQRSDLGCTSEVSSRYASTYPAVEPRKIKRVLRDTEPAASALPQLLQPGEQKPPASSLVVRCGLERVSRRDRGRRGTRRDSAAPRGRSLRLELSWSPSQTVGAVSRLPPLLLIAGLVGAWSGSDSGDHRAARPSGRIAFIRGDFPERDLVVMRADDRSFRIVDGPRIDAKDFSWSPDGRRLVFSAARPGLSMDLYVVNADGTGKRRLPPLRGNELVPVWSPRVNKIAFEVEDDADRSIWVVNPDGTGRRKLTTGFDRGFEFPAWSPDGRKIAFNQLAHDERLNGSIYVMNSDGRKLRRVGRSREHAAPQWTPAGKVAYASGAQIWVVNADGSGRRRILRAGTKSRDAAFAWSPNGRTLVYVGLGAVERDHELLLANTATGRTTRRLTSNPMEDTAPSWSDDGKMLACLRYRDGDNPDAYDVYLINADGSGERNLTASRADESRPIWAPSRR